MRDDYRCYELADLVTDHFGTVYQPGAGQFHAVIAAVENPTTGTVAFSGSIYGNGGFPIARIGLIAGKGALQLLNDDVHNDIDPKWSPDGATLAFLSDRGQAEGNFQLHFAQADEPSSQRLAVALKGQVIESFAWSADGARILIQAADAGADAAGSASRARIGTGADATGPAWAPAVIAGHDHAWRRAYVWDVAQDRLTAIGDDGQNVWEAAWCGDDAVVAILSDSPTEGGWYDTGIGIAPAAGGGFVPFLAAERELGVITASPDGRWISFVEGRFHRGLSLGTLALVDRRDGRRLDVAIGAEVSAMQWRDGRTLFFAGVVDAGMVIGDLDVETLVTTILWQSDGAAGRKVPFASPTGPRGALVPAHAFDRYPRLLRIEEGAETTLLDLATPAITALIARMGPAEVVRWPGRDGLEITGYLARPKGIAKPPLVAFIHGGPSHLFRNAWTADNPLVALLVDAGYAVLFANPRGSSGRGVDFAERVIGDWGGEDRHDILAGIDHVVAHYPVDGTRLFAIGGSYGGYMTSWLVTQTDRFSAACAIVPLTDMRSFHFTAHHPEFLAIYTRGDPYESGGIYDARSPLRHADKVTTPTLLIAGALDNTTPQTQAAQFYRALALRGVPTELVIYPQEGHAVTGLEAQIDQGTRILRWFAEAGR